VPRHTKAVEPRNKSTIFICTFMWTCIVTCDRASWQISL
jgi:hypothetical protein